MWRSLPRYKLFTDIVKQSSLYIECYKVKHKYNSNTDQSQLYEAQSNARQVW